MSYIEMQEMCGRMLERFHILSAAVGIESGEGEKPVGVGGWVGRHRGKSNHSLQKAKTLKLPFFKTNTESSNKNKPEILYPPSPLPHPHPQGGCINRLSRPGKMINPEQYLVDECENSLPTGKDQI